MTIREDDELRSTDVIAQANEIAMRDTAGLVAVARAASAPEGVPDGKGGVTLQVKQEDGSYPVRECVACDDPLPLGRQELGRIRCVDCQTLKEKRR